jgi:hypothetical protein
MVVSFDKLLYLLGHLPIMHLKEYGLTVEPFAGLRSRSKVGDSAYISRVLDRQ